MREPSPTHADLLWQPTPAESAATAMSHFMARVHHPDYASLWQWSVDRPGEFWRALWDFCAPRGDPGCEVLLQAEQMPGARWFPQARLNYAENLLEPAVPHPAQALIFWGEDKVRRQLDWNALKAETGRFQQHLLRAGVVAGDRVAGYLPNLPETLAAMLATTALGAVWSSASPDFGVQGVLDRFGQIAPKVLVCVDGYWYNGKAISCLSKNAQILQQLPSVTQVVLVPYLNGNAPDLTAFQENAWRALQSATPAHCQLWSQLPEPGEQPLVYRRVPFEHPLFILFSSGTTGVPKCIVHGHGGVLLQHLKEHRLHGDVRPGDRLFYFTTCGWMMWNWLMSGLASGATLLLYDGAPFAGGGNLLFDFAQQTRMTHLGISAKFIDTALKSGLCPASTHDLESLRVVFSTGSPLSPEGFRWVYGHLKPRVLLASISGGTDIVSCFVLGNPVLPVHAGEIQCRGLGMAVAVFDAQGRSVVGQKGELVCTRPFPAMPVGFWNDPQGTKYQAAYFQRYARVWCHGDYAELTPRGGVLIHGRSDATLNPGGVRIGTAEIYRQVEQLPEVLESLVIGQDWPPENPSDVRIVLFVKLEAGRVLDVALRQRIAQRIREEASPRHVPAVVVQVTDIPRTRSGKIVELAVRQVVHGQSVHNLEALANPEALEQFRNRPELKGSS